MEKRDDGILGFLKVEDVAEESNPRPLERVVTVAAAADPGRLTHLPLIKNGNLAPNKVDILETSSGHAIPGGPPSTTTNEVKQKSSQFENGQLLKMIDEDNFELRLQTFSP